MLQILKLIRVHQWVKNLFVFIPAFFAHALFDVDNFLRALLGFVAFSLVASSVYIINDYKDIEKDKLHPEKKSRPLASGAIKPRQAFIYYAFLILFGGGLSLYIGINFTLIVFAYMFMNLLYSFFLKHVSLIDIFIISIGFQMRIFAGSELVEVPISRWLIIMTFLLSLFIAFGKRREDVLLSEQGSDVRKSIEGYNKEFVLAGMIVSASVTLVSYIMYSLSEEVIQRIGHDNVYISTIFVVMGLLRFLQLALVYEKTGSPTKILLKDTFIQLSVLGWGITMGLLIYA